MNALDHALIALNDLDRGRSLEATTIRLMRSHVHNHLVELLAGHQLDQLDTAAVQRWVNEWDGTRPTLDRVLATLRTIHNELVTQQSAPAIAWAALRRPRGTDVPEAPIGALTVADVNQLAHLAGEHNGSIIRFLAYTGLRLGEACALEPGDLHTGAEAPYVVVSRSLKRTGSVGATKTHQQRVVYLLDMALAALDGWLDQEWVGCTDHPYLFSTETGGRIWHANWNQRVWRPLVTAWGRPEVRTHDLRHTFASLLIRAGAPSMFVARQLGHADDTITRKVYAHWYAEDDTAAVALVNRALA